MNNFENSIFIIGRSNISIRHYNILKKIYKKKIYFISQKKNLYVREKNFFISTKIKFQKIFNPFMVIISSPSNTHLEYLKIFINKSKYILVEKPISNNLKNTLLFYKKIKSTKIKSKIIIGYNMRNMKILIKFRELIKKKILGKIYFAECTVGKSIRLWRNGKLNFACTKNKTGGGSLLELSHEIDYLRWLFGDLIVVSKYINPKKFYKFDVEQNVFVTLKSKNFPIQLSMDIIRNQPERFCKIICENGTILMDLIKNKIFILSNKNSKHIQFSLNDLNVSYRTQIKNLVYQKVNSLQNIKEAIEVLKIIESIKNEN